MSNKKKTIISIVITLLITVLVVTATYAWFKWRTNNNQTVNINLTASSVITYYGGNDIVGILEPVFDYSDGVEKKIRVSSDLPGNYFSLYLKINSLPDELKVSSFKGTLYKNGVFVFEESFDFLLEYPMDEIPLLTDASITSDGYDEYTLYFWIDGTVDNSYTMSGKRIDFDLYATGESGALEERFGSFE